MVKRPLNPKDDRFTPENIAAAIAEALGGIPDLDPCSHPLAPRIAQRTIVPPRDGLAIPWLGNVIVNPPYSKTLPWAQKAVAEVIRENAQAIAFIRAAEAPALWSRILNSASWGQVEMDRRLAFARPDGVNDGDLRAFGKIWILGTERPDFERWRKAFDGLGQVADFGRPPCTHGLSPALRQALAGT